MAKKKPAVPPKSATLPRPPAATPPRPTPNVAPPAPLRLVPVVEWPAGVLALLGFLLYLNTYGHGYVLDDIAAISQNLFVKKGIAGIPDLLRTEFWHFSNISLGYYRPLSLITFALEQEFFGDNPSVSHIINAILYGATGWVVGLLLQKWFGAHENAATSTDGLRQNATAPHGGPSADRWLAFLTGLLFMAHPIHTEIVANIKGRDELLSFLGIAVALLLHWRFLETGRWTWLGGAAFALYLAFLSKESAVVSLALFVGATYWFGRQSFGRALLGVWPFLAVAILFFFQKQAMIGTITGKPPVDWANYPYAIEKTQVATTFKFLAYYVRLLVLPHPLVYDYSYNVIPSGRAGDPLVWAGVALAVALAAGAVVGFFRRTLWGFALFWFWITMVPALGFIFSRGGILAERFLYMPALAYALLVVWGLSKLRRSEPGNVAPNYVLLGVVGVITALFAFKTVTRNQDWKDNFTLFNSALPAHAESCQVQRHVANEWIEKGVRAKTKVDSLRYGRLAIEHLQQATRIYPTFGEAYFSIAYVFQKIIPNRDSAIYYYKQTIRAAPVYAPAYNNLGVIYQGEAVQQAQRAPQLAQRKLELASYYYNRSMDVNPAYQDGKDNWARLKTKLNLDVKYLPDSVLAQY